MLKGKSAIDISVEQKGNDELSVLSRSFNSMLVFIRDYIKKQGDLTKQIEAANEELKRKDQLKDEFIRRSKGRLLLSSFNVFGSIVCSCCSCCCSDTNLSNAS